MSSLMDLHQDRYVAALVPDEKWLILSFEKKYLGYCKMQQAIIQEQSRHLDLRETYLLLPQNDEKILQTAKWYFKLS